MADEKVPAKDAAPEGGGDMTLSEITATLKAIAPQIAALTQAMAAMAKPAPAAAEVVDGDPAATPPADKPVDAAAMDAAINDGVAKALASIKSRDALAVKLSHHVGTFDHSDMTHGDVVKYGIEKLGIKGAPAGSEAVYLDAFLAAKPVPTRGAATVAQDAADTSEVPAFLKDCGITGE